MKERGIEGFDNLVKGRIPYEKIEHYFNLTQKTAVANRYRYYRMRQYEAGILMYEWDRTCNEVRNRLCTIKENVRSANTVLKMV